jgi:hypothetical protein
MAVDAPRYVLNTAIRRDLQIPTVKEEIRRYSSQYSARLSAHPNDLTVNLMELPDNKTPAKWSAYQICLSGFLRFGLEASFPKATRGLEPISYRGALLGTLLHAIICVFTQFAEYTSNNNSMVWVRERTTPTERPPHVGEVIANFCG